MKTLNKDFSMNINFFMEIEDEICRLIMQSHWKRFKTQMHHFYVFE